MRLDDFKSYHNLTYLNSAFTSLSPLPVVEAIVEYYNKWRLSPTGMFESTNEILEHAYEDFKIFLGASSKDNIVFTKNCTEAINHAELSLELNWTPSDSIVVSEAEYAPNVLPWLRACSRRGCELRVARCDQGTIDLMHLTSLVDNSTKLVAVTHCSNLFGSVNPIRDIADIAHAAGALCMVDGAQAVSYMPVDINSLGVDLYALSGHKALGPTGSGLLVLNNKVAELLTPLFIGDAGVKFYENGRYEFRPHFMRFFGGLSDSAGIIGLANAFVYLRGIGLAKVEAHLNYLRNMLIKELSMMSIELVSITHGGSLVTFSLESDSLNERLWKYLNEHQIIVQLLDIREFPFISGRIKKQKLIRCSFHIYNDERDICRLVSGIQAFLQDNV